MFGHTPIIFYAEMGKYKFGNNELDLDDYITNLENNVDSYLQYQNWDTARQDEFKKEWNAYKGLLQQVGDNDYSQVSADDFGTLSGLGIPQGQNDLTQRYYNKRNEAISADEYNLLRDRKKRKYQDFNANAQVSNFMKLVAQQMINSKKGPDKYDPNKYGFLTWWSTVKNPNGGKDLSPYLDMDPYDETTGKRAINNRAAAAAGYLGEYINWLNDKDLDYSDNAITKEDLLNRLNTLKNNWGNNQWDQDDLASAAQAGIDQSWLTGFFTEKKNPLQTDAEIRAQQEALDKEQKAAEEAERRAAYEQWANEQYNTYNNNTTNYKGIDNAWRSPNTLSFEGMEQLPTSNWQGYLTSEGKLDYDKIYNQWLTNPFDSRFAQIGLSMALDPNGGRAAKQLDNGVYYIPRRADIANNRALLYDPQYGLYYDFIGAVKDRWNRMNDDYYASVNGTSPASAWYQYRKLGGKLQYGGSFNDYAAARRKSELDSRASQNGRAAYQQAAAERIIGKTDGSAVETSANPDADWSAGDYARAMGAAADIVSGISAFVPGYGTVVSGASGLGSTALNAFADFNDDSLTAWDAAKNFAINIGFDLAGMIPGGGSASKFAKIAKNSGKIISKAGMILGTLGAFNNADGIKSSFAKFSSDPTNLSVEDWQNIAQGIGVAFGITGAIGRNATRNLTDADAGMPYQRRPGKVENSVAVDFVDASGNKQTRIFDGEDAKRIREANGDINKIKAATTEKYADLYGLDIATSSSRFKWQGVRDQSGKWRMPGVRKGDPKANVFDVVTDDKGTYVQRRWNEADDYSRQAGPGETIDERISRDKSITDAQMSSERTKNVLDNLQPKLDDYNKRIADNTTAASTLSARSRADIEAHLQAIDDAATSGTHQKRTKDLAKFKANQLDGVNANGAPIDGNINKARKAKLVKEKADDATLNKLKADIKAKQAEIDAEKDPTIQKQKRLEKRTLNKALKDAKEKRAKIDADYDNKYKDAAQHVADEEQWLKDYDMSNKKNVQDELSRRADIENYEAENTKLSDKVSRWEQFRKNPNKSAAYERLRAKVDADGNITFDIGRGNTVKRKFDDILKEFNILYRRGGKFQSGGYLNSDARNLLGFAVPRAIAADRYNNKITSLAQDANNIVSLANPFTYSRQVYGDLASEQEGHKQAGQLYHMASTPLTADGGLQQAVNLESAYKGQEAINTGLLQSNKTYRTNQELAYNANLESNKNIHTTAEANSSALAKVRQQSKALEQARLNKQFTNRDTLLQEMQLINQKRDAEDWQYRKSDIHNQVTYNLKNYVPNIDDNALNAWNKVNTGTNYTDLTESEQSAYLRALQRASNAEMNELRKARGFMPGFQFNSKQTALRTPWEALINGQIQINGDTSNYTSNK